MSEFNNSCYGSPFVGGVANEKNTVHYNAFYTLVLWNYAHKDFPYEGGK
jgi:hypothetical protein